jgi:large subunit ribosomal protein L10
MLKTEKEKVVADLVERLRASETLLIADYRGLTHAELDDVRTQLLNHGARFTIVKNTLTKRAADEAGVDGLHEFLTGPTAIAFVNAGDMVAVAKTLSETARTTRRLELKGGLLDGKSIDADAVRDLATLPPLDVLRGQVLGAVVAPLTSLLGLVGAPLQNLVGLIDARIDQLEAGGAEAPAQAEEAPAAADEAPAAEEEAPAAEDEAPAAEDEAAAPDEATAPEEQPAASADAEPHDETQDEASSPEEPAEEREE